MGYLWKLNLRTSRDEWHVEYYITQTMDLREIIDKLKNVRYIAERHWNAQFLDTVNDLRGIPWEEKENENN